MLHIAAHKLPDGSTATFLFDQDEQVLFRQERGELYKMGRPENFVFPNVPLPQHMTTNAARRITCFCKDWIERKNGSN
jgi:hypothetical protein